jgi:hypothetical protein
MMPNTLRKTSATSTRMAMAIPRLAFMAGHHLLDLG